MQDYCSVLESKFGEGFCGRGEGNIASKMNQTCKGIIDLK